MKLSDWQAQKKADQLVRSEAGRKALEARLNVKFDKTPEPETPAEQIRVEILVPTFRTPLAEMQNSMRAMINATRAAGIQCYTSTASIRSSIVSWARNQLIASLLDSKLPFTHVLFVDDDMVLEPDTLIKLLSHKKDITTALCTVKKDPPIPNIRWVEEGKDVYWTFFDWPKNALLEVGAGGTGVMLISRHTLEQVAQAYFDCMYEKEYWQLSDESERVQYIKKQRMAMFDEVHNGFWFRLLPGLQGCNEYGEDVSFCLMAKRYCGISTFCDTSVQPGHVGDYEFGIKDYLVYKDEAMEKAKAEGRYLDPGHKKVENDQKYSAKISILLPTRGRPENVSRLLASLRETSLQMPQVVLYRDTDDIVENSINWGGPCSFELCKDIIGDRRTLTECWNECFKACYGDIVMFAADDLIFRTKHWDVMVAKAFEECEDKMLFVYGDDGHWGKEFGTHGFLSRKWVETLGYVLPPYFVSDFGDTWINEIAEAIGRRKYLPFVTEHMHFLWKKAPMDKTYQERLDRHKIANPEGRYRELAEKRQEDVEKLRAAMLEVVNA